MLKKRFTLLILSVLIIASTVGCGNQENLLTEGHNTEQDTEQGTEDVPDQVENSDVFVPETVPYTQVGVMGFSSRPLFEIISSESNHVDDGNLAVTTLTRELAGEDFNFYIIDDTGKFLGSGYNAEYTPYTYNTDEPPFETPAYAIPFPFFYSKYFAEIEYTSTEYASKPGDPFGRKTYVFTVHPKTYAYYEATREALSLLHKSMSLALGENVKVIVRAYTDGQDEIRVETPDPEKKKK